MSCLRQNFPEAILRYTFFFHQHHILILMLNFLIMVHQFIMNKLWYVNYIWYAVALASLYHNFIFITCRYPQSWSIDFNNIVNILINFFDYVDLIWTTCARSVVLPYRCTWSMLSVFGGVWVAPLLLLLCMYDFSYLIFFIVYVCFLCLVFAPGLHSFDYR